MSLLGGIRPPIALLSALLLSLAGITALTLGPSGQDPIPEAVLTSQQHFAEDGAIALRASVDESVTDLNRVAGLFGSGGPVAPDAVLDKLGNVYQKWLGTAVIEIESGKLLATRGENVPLTMIDRRKLSEEDGLAPRMVRLQNGETRLLSFALLAWNGQPQQLLVASSGLKVPSISLGQSRAIAVIDQKGTVLSSDGIREAERGLTDRQREEVARSKKQLNTIAKVAAQKAGQHPLKTKEPGSGGYLGVSGSLLGERFLGNRSVAGYATLAGAQPGESTVATGLGLTVVAMVKVAEDPTRTTDPVFGLVAAGALLVIGALAVALLIGTVQRPLIQLFLESRRLTRGDLTRPVTVPKYSEASRIGISLERLRRQLLGEPVDAWPSEAAAPAGRRSRIGTRGLLVVCAVLLLAWAAPLVLLLNRADATVVVPQQLVNDQRERTDTLSDRVRRALNEGYADLSSVASLIGDRTTPADMTKVLERIRAEHLRYQSLYVLDANGKILARAGDKPRHPAGEDPRAEPIRLLGYGGKEPVITGYAEIPGRAGVAVVGEFRISFLNSILKRPGLGKVWVVDEKHRVIGGNTGYRAFEKLSSKRLDTLVEGTHMRGDMNPRPSGVLYRDDDGVQIAGAASFVGGGAAQPLRWTVVSWQPASGLAIPEYSLQNRTVLAGMLGLTAAAACLGWLHIVVGRPLRELVRQAEALAGGDRRTVLYPHHHDEVGAVARSLELLRQQLQQQRKRDGVPLVGRN